ncbi:MAG: hypothetical protein JRH01_11640 [Deltaproteobacteria bacterium]|nr:hypothetical protein [Deltaproteobacteria bacterium]
MATKRARSKSNNLIEEGVERVEEAFTQLGDDFEQLQKSAEKRRKEFEKNAERRLKKGSSVPRSSARISRSGPTASARISRAAVPSRRSRRSARTRTR